MITLIIDKCLRHTHHMNYGHNNRLLVTNSDGLQTGINSADDHQTRVSLMSKFTVMANEVKAEDEASGSKAVVDTEIIDKQVLDVSDLTSKDYYRMMTGKEYWKTFRHLWNRKMDTKDPKYLDQFLRPGETGEDRIKLMWTEYLHGEDNPETTFIMNSAFAGLLGGFFYGGVMSNQTATTDFIRRHNEFVYRGDLEGKRKIRDTMHIQFVRAGSRWAWRMFLFCGALSGGATMAIAYRNEIYIRDCVLTGTLVCALWKAKLGLRAMAVSGVFGSILGAFFGASSKLLLWSFNTSVPEYRYWRHVRYRGYLEPEKYSDGSSEYKWEDKTDSNRHPDYRSETEAMRRDN